MRLVSYSQLRTAMRCPWKWGLHYGFGWRQKKEAESEPLRIGKAMHQALACVYSAGVPIQWPDQTNAVDVEELDDLLTLQSFYEAYAEQDLENFDILATEWPLRVAVPTPRGTRSNYLFVGWIDLIAQHKETGLISVWDHKTTKRAVNDVFVDYQLSLYAWALRRLGLTPDVVILNTIKRPSARKPPEVLRLPVPKAPPELEGWSTRLYNMCKQVPPKGTPLEHLAKNVTRDCNWDCEFRDVCKLHNDGEIEGARGLLHADFERGEPGPTFPREEYHNRVPKAWIKRAAQ